MPGRLSALLDQEYPRFSESEMRRRRGLMLALAQRAGVDLVLVCGEQRAGGGVGWLTGWPVTAEAVAVFDPARTSVLFFELVDHNAAYVDLRLVKSDEELDWVRIGAWMSDLAIESILRNAREGMDERALWRLCEQAYVGEGGTTWIHYFGVTSMAAPDCCVPAQHRRVGADGALSGSLRDRRCGFQQQLEGNKKRHCSRRVHSSKPRALLKRQAIPPAMTWCTVSSAATCLRCSAARAGRRGRSRISSCRQG